MEDQEVKAERVGISGDDDIDGESLAELMIDHNVGVSEKSRYVVNKIDIDYFEG